MEITCTFCARMTQSLSIAYSSNEIEDSPCRYRHAQLQASMRAVERTYRPDSYLLDVGFAFGYLVAGGSGQKVRLTPDSVEVFAAF